MDRIRVAKLESGAKLPTRKNWTDAGADLYAFLPTGPLEVKGVAIIRTGITVELPDGYVGLIWPKSGSNFLIGGGVIDSTYQGEILVKVIAQKDSVVVTDGMAIGQLLIQPVVTPAIEEVSITSVHKTKSARNTDGGIVREAKGVGKVTEVKE